ncbi:MULTISPECIES: beta-ribofuranosylaminobenzene 5'-phosphate synthase family protein [Methylosinus]|uniref:GHMP kinase n=1 Tax=Methylosinus trichosporium (strain ATCC 35070 / NCIMB 11131 / UNIQEM 75 / OB3b) TaxID=595536 RepID=A0A2D2CZV1_METT3|nr:MULTISPECIES: beta-ribofuranosylaminobenzene 5'-phosphate synthase family protein [Methylosinus]ATQ68214.1 GHMP kinase [Methylosinus trichosporium OB3b]OBS50578.1 GHMP kinase [Methylosinus sp. 3S-1]
MPTRVSVAAAARLHLGFLDMNGALGRKFGGLGLSIDAPATRLTLEHAETTSVFGPDAERAAALLERAAAAHAPGRRYRLVMEEAIPPHSGLGSGTQLALAVAAALRRLEDLPQDVEADAALLQRGARSGLGAGLFSRGGLVVDGGRGAATRTPPVVSRLPFPPDWRILLVSDPTAVGLHGAEERKAFAELPAFSETDAGRLCRLVLMQALPAASEADFAGFGAAITEIQAIVGDYFAPAQGGRRFTSAAVERLLAGLAEAGATGVGQTSWGPTGFAFAPSEAEAQRLAARARDMSAAHGLTIAVVAGLDKGAKIDAVYARIA